MAVPSFTARWKLGLFVVLGIGLGLFALGWISVHALHRDTVQFYFFFDEEVSGLDPGAAVEFRGVQIGRVTRIRAAPDRRHVEVLSDVFLDTLRDMRLSVEDILGEGRPDDDAPELRAQLETTLLTGVTIILLDFFDPRRFPVEPTPFEVPHNTVPTVPSTLKLIQQGVVELTEGFPDLTSEATASLRVLRGELERAELASLAAETSRVVGSLAAQLEQLEQLELLRSLRDTLQAGTEVLAELQALGAELRGEDGLLATTARPWQESGEILAEVLVGSDLPTTMRLLRELSLEMSYASGEFALLVSTTRRDMELFRETLDSVRRLADTLERDPAALLRGRTHTSPFLETR